LLDEVAMDAAPVLPRPSAVFPATLPSESTRSDVTRGNRAPAAGGAAGAHHPGARPPGPSYYRHADDLLQRFRRVVEHAEACRAHVTSMGRNIAELPTWNDHLRHRLIRYRRALALATDTARPLQDLVVQGLKAREFLGVLEERKEARRA